MNSNLRVVKWLADRLAPADQWLLKQHLADTRFYGDGGTIHGTTHLDVETAEGEVVSVWYRCQMLPFEQHEVDSGRAQHMRASSTDSTLQITGVEVR